MGPREGGIYESLRGRISSALQGALLVTHVREHAAEIARQNAEITRQKYVLDTFMETVPARIYFKDREGRIIRANQAHARQMGFNDPEEEIGKSDFDFFDEEHAKPAYEDEQKIIKTKKPIINILEKEVRKE